MKNAPERIFLQAGSHIEPDDDFKEFAADGVVTWNDARVWDGDVEYVRLDLVVAELLRNIEAARLTPFPPGGYVSNAVSKTAHIISREEYFSK